MDAISPRERKFVTLSLCGITVTLSRVQNCGKKMWNQTKGVLFIRWSKFSIARIF